VKSVVNQSNLANKSEILSFIDSKPWEASWSQDFLSDHLQGARCLELIEETIKGA